MDSSFLQVFFLLWDKPANEGWGESLENPTEKHQPKGSQEESDMKELGLEGCYQSEKTILTSWTNDLIQLYFAS